MSVSGSWSFHLPLGRVLSLTSSSLLTGLCCKYQVDKKTLLLLSSQLHVTDAAPTHTILYLKVISNTWHPTLAERFPLKPCSPLRSPSIVEERGVLSVSRYLWWKYRSNLYEFHPNNGKNLCEMSQAETKNYSYIYIVHNQCLQYPYSKECNHFVYKLFRALVNLHTKKLFCTWRLEYYGKTTLNWQLGCSQGGPPPVYSSAMFPKPAMHNFCDICKKYYK